MRASRIHAWLDDDRSTGYWVLLLGTPLVLALAASLVTQVAMPDPAFYEYVQEYLRTGHIAEVAIPLEYAWLIGLSIQVLGQHGMEILQTTMYVLTVVSVWKLARRIEVGSRYALLAGLMTAVYPQLPASVVKLWDVDFSVFVMVVLLLCTVLIVQMGPRIPLVSGTGIVFGCGMAERPNMLLLLPLLVYAIFASHARWRWKVIVLIGAGAVSAGTLIAVNTLAHGSFFLPGNGPYNFAQGHNEFTVEALLQNQSSEQSVSLFMKADGLSYQGEDIIANPKFQEFDPQLQRYFIHHGLEYIRNHPINEVKITAVKLYIFLSPYRRLHRGLNLWTIPVSAMATVIPVWLILLLRKSRCGFDSYDRIFIATAVLYVLPFLLTATDPRYQFPLDIVLLPHIARLIEDHPSVSAQAAHASTTQAAENVQPV
jgi:hypothetical protein